MLTVFSSLAGLPAAGVAQAQDRLPIGTHVGTAAPVPTGTPGVYEETGRRDPFVSLLASKKSIAPASSRPKAGLAGIALADVAVKGVVQNGKTVIAVLEGPGGKSFVARSKDRLQDATVKAIDPDGVTFSTQVVDAMGVSHPRDVRKSLRQTAAEEPR
jgi:Tfp pilus assembly protein PilP